MPPDMIARDMHYITENNEIFKMTTQYLLIIGMFTSSLERPPNSTVKLF